MCPLLHLLTLSEASAGGGVLEAVPGVLPGEVLPKAHCPCRCQLGHRLRGNPARGDQFALSARPHVGNNFASFHTLNPEVARSLYWSSPSVMQMQHVLASGLLFGNCNMTCLPTSAEPAMGIQHQQICTCSSTGGTRLGSWSVIHNLSVEVAG